ncbi:MAG TPA: peptidylprolyl isomerase [Acidimicrobiales bacterium]|nr:peptidylprolyl isomerase [Acidimicrobiales bacterium]
MRKLTLKLVVMASIGATVGALVALVAVAAAAADTYAASKPSTTVLVPVSAAGAAGFTKVVNAPTTSTTTGVTGCPYGAQEEFANASGTLELVSEVLYCSSTADAIKLLKSVASNGKAQAGLTPPKSLGSTAVERVGSDSSYLIAWRRGSGFELTGLSTSPPSSSTTSTTAGTPVPLTAQDKQELATAATQQSARFTNVTVSSGTGGSAADKKAQATANATSVAAGCPKNPATELKKSKWTSAPAMTIDPTKTYTATVKTDVGTFVIALDAKDAPQTVNNFVFLAQQHFFDCVTFLRVIPTFVDQTGDPTGTGSGGPGYAIPDELPAKASNAADQYPLGSVAMANTGQPNTGGSQWFIVAGAEGESLSNTYSLFGQVTSGMSVVEKINAQGSASGVPPDVTHRMLKVTISSS